MIRQERERDELQEELRSLQRDRDQSLLQAETDKQQVRLALEAHGICVVCVVTVRWRLQALSVKEAEKAVLSEKVSALQAELSTAALELERLNRETALLRDQERVRTLHYCMLSTTDVSIQSCEIHLHKKF